MLPSKQISTKAFVVDSPGASFVLQDVVLDEVRDNEVLVEMKYTGLCHTDIVVQNGAIPVGDYPAVLGHEGAGIVRRIGKGVKDKTLAEGDLVFLSFTTCNSCRSCKEGRNGFCRRFTEINFGGVRGISAKDSPISSTGGQPVRGQFFGQSSMSKLAIISETSIVKSPSSLGVTEADMASLAPLGCGYLTGAGTVLNILKPKLSTSFAVLGMGAVGFAAMMAARAQGVENVIAVDIVDAKLTLAKSLGASYTLNTKTVPNLEQGLREIFPDGVDHILDTTGVASLLQSSIAALGHEGTLAIVGVAPADASLSINPLEFMINCKRIVGAIEGSSNPSTLLPQLIDWYKQGKFPVDKLVEVYDLTSLDRALDDLRTGKVIKPVIKWMDL
ncbi:Polyketide synthase enoylreductase [Penicillium macrosclerotiorum]|uniref:Polyketide synthase enoylreductase n=1 Tax=Penicillium macrosclerotiorum TaxID=303699 RepID=UPI0025475787|nr:Polyketide synthase enoylreductase [Penicillium macrosclerotiorum]KAJ5679643.1 Polyketide synthase enoylreductase [Penicillium macrosclerotiorum]